MRWEVGLLTAVYDHGLPMSSLPATPFPAPTRATTAVAAGAVALPFLFGFTQPPMSNFWPLLASGACGLVLLALAAWQLHRAAAAEEVVHMSVRWLAWGLAVAGVLGGVVGLVQFFWGDVGLTPWIYASTPGQAIGNLRQRNQQASLLALGAWGVLWLMAQRRSGSGGVDRAQALGMAGLVLMAVFASATASRTGALQWVLMLGMCWLWRASLGRVWRWAVLGVVVYCIASLVLPWLLQALSGASASSALARFSRPENTCSDRPALWGNILHLIAQQPWSGWGWGELAYAHYVTLFPGVRFCTLLDNAHNLPLHLAVELGLPAALLLSVAAVSGVVRAKPWAETQPSRQLAWGALAIVAVHSMLEFPLWYGPFQLVCLAAVTVLCRHVLGGLGRRPQVAVIGLGAAVGVGLMAGVLIAQDYRRVVQLYLPASQRMPAYRSDTQRKVLAETRIFREAAYFAVVTTTPVTAENAAYLHDRALEVLHYSPEPRVIKALLASAAQLGRTDEVAFHSLRYRIAYPGDYARWERRSAGEGSPP